MTSEAAARGTITRGEVILAARRLSSGYGSQPVLHEIELEVRRGQVVALLGPNGAGKTTTVLTLAGEIKPLGGEVYFAGAPSGAPLFRRARCGMGYVGEVRSVIMGLSVHDNLRVANVSTSDAFALFPELSALARRQVGLCSGGEQQMLALARAMGRSPTMLLADELSLGLAPLVVDRLLEAVRVAADERQLSVLLVEQHIEKALNVADYVYVIRSGTIVMRGSSSDMKAKFSEIEEAYLA
jgi:branched-chain amino acid transport system ATP-binding protein